MKLRKSLVKPVTRQNISSCSVLPSEIVMQDAFSVTLWTSADICRHAWQSRVDDLGWKNRTTCYNCRFSAMSLALRVVFSGRTTLYKTLKSDRTSEIEHRRVMGCKKKYIEMLSSFIEPFSWFIFPCCSSLQLAKVLIVIISQVLFIAESANNIQTIYCNGHEYNQLGYTQDGPINSEKGLNALYVGSSCISWVIHRTVT